jgi:hypothetical protein
MEIKANDGKIYKLPENPKWRSTNPPEIGWWPASLYSNILAIRYWDGQGWSYALSPRHTETLAEKVISMEKSMDVNVRYSDRWWLNQPEGYPKIAL